MSRQTRYPTEVRERAVHFVPEHEGVELAAGGDQLDLGKARDDGRLAARRLRGFGSPSRLALTAEPLRFRGLSAMRS